MSNFTTAINHYEATSEHVETFHHVNGSATVVLKAHAFDDLGVYDAVHVSSAGAIKFGEGYEGDAQLWQIAEDFTDSPVLAKTSLVVDTATAKRLHREAA